MRHPWANVALLVLVAVQVATGFAGLLGSGDGFRVAFWVHAVGAYAIFVVLFAKAVLVSDEVRRRPGLHGGRTLLLAAGVLLAATLVTGMVWIAGGNVRVLSVSLINLHAYLALALSAILVWHVLDRRWIVRVPRAADRGAFLRLAGVAAAGLAVWQAERWTQRLLGLPGSRRRWTGSYETASHSGGFPSVSWLDDDPDPVDAAAWRLRVEGAVERPLDLSHEQVLALAGETREALIDCTGGWYSRQRWTGVPLARLLEMAGAREAADSVRVEGVTGYARRFSVSHARGLLLATAVAGAPLSHGHGFPARLVVPSRRGFDWVKWVVRIEVSESSHLLQPPLPLT